MCWEAHNIGTADWHSKKRGCVQRRGKSCRYTPQSRLKLKSHCELYFDECYEADECCEARADLKDMLAQLIGAIAVAVQQHERQILKSKHDQATACGAPMGHSRPVLQKQRYLTRLVERKVH